ncbi:hypothetical protein F5H01DRAFT_372498 [Linnemannia elongata]|nr:hypothetical protein F5H01DRAFT_372498 [Linnemannia elongata]
MLLFLGEKQGLQSPLLMVHGSVFRSKEFLSFKMDVVAVLLMERVELPKDIPDNMLRALEVSSSDHSGDMQELRKVMIAVNDKLTQQTNQSNWANDMLAGITKAFLAQQEQLRI